MTYIRVKTFYGMSIHFTPGLSLEMSKLLINLQFAQQVCTTNSITGTYIITYKPSQDGMFLTFVTDNPHHFYLLLGFSNDLTEPIVSVKFEITPSLVL